jgi:hypothetical protein
MFHLTVHCATAVPYVHSLAGLHFTTVMVHVYGLAGLHCTIAVLYLEGPVGYALYYVQWHIS